MILFFLAALIGLAAITIALWKFGFVADAEHPSTVDDKPVMDPRQQKAIRGRLERWRAEGKLTRAEFERIQELCETDW